MTDDVVERLQLRLDRERRARRQAEIIAERGMRELWQANSELQQRVTRRTADLERQTRIEEYREWTRMTLVSRSAAAALRELDKCGAHPATEPIIEAGRHLDTITGVATEVAARSPELIETTRALVDVADDVIDGWQQVAARSGRLLSVEVGPGPDSVAVDWSAARAALDAALDHMVRHVTRGALVVTLTGTEDGVDVRIVGGAMPHAGPARTPGSSAGVDDRFAEAELIIERVDGTIRTDADSERFAITITLPTVVRT